MRKIGLTVSAALLLAVPNTLAGGYTGKGVLAEPTPPGAPLSGSRRHP